jgi:ribosome biogenesis GTPase
MADDESNAAPPGRPPGSPAGWPPGWDEGWQAARAAVDPEGAWTAVRISAEHRGAYHAMTGAAPAAGASADGAAEDTAEAAAEVSMIELRGRAYRAAADKRDLPAVGDFCLVSRWQEAVAGAGSATIEALLPRRSLLVRRAAGNASAPQPLAANVDLAMIVTSANSDLSAQRLDRYLELVRDGGIAPMVVVSKLDLAADGAALLAEVARLAPGVPLLATSVPLGLGFDRVAAAVGAGRTAILIGSSGVGKSSILNALARASAAAEQAPPAGQAGQAAAQATGEIRARDERGQHTTTARQLFAMPDGSLWIDTPGMRELAAYAEGDPAIAFADVTELASACRFADCQHRQEPGCAVAAAVARGKLTAARLASYHKLRDERAKDRERRATATKIAEHRAGQRTLGKQHARKRPPQG